MFGGLASYLDGRLVMVLAEDESDLAWYGILLPTEREYHADLMRAFPQLRPHEILKKWLFLPGSHEEFEEVATAIGRLIQRRDPRFGVVPIRKRKKARKGKLRRRNELD